MIDIKDISGNIRFSTPINQGSKRKFLLMKEDYITLKFSLDKLIPFSLGDNVDHEIGMFELVDLYKPDYNIETGAYEYNLRLDAYYWKWKNKMFFFTPENGGREASWNLTDSLKVHMQVFLKNLEVLGYKYQGEAFECTIDDSVNTSSKLISYDSTNLIDALSQMAEAFECEWWVVKNEIHFGRCENGDPVDFELGMNVGKMDRSDSQSTYATRIYAFGSTRNIPLTYRKKLVFDVKDINGRDLSDTARSLVTDFFPSDIVTEEKHVIDPIITGTLNSNHREFSNNNDLVDTLVGSIYKIIDKGNGISFGTGTYYMPMPGQPSFPRDYLPAGEYVFRVSFIYLQDGIEKEILIGSNTVTLNENQQHEINLSFPIISVPLKLGRIKN